jgi:BASS family bile acid:Na+ symporter
MVFSPIKRGSTPGFFLTAASVLLLAVALVAMVCRQSAIWHPAMALGTGAFAVSLYFSSRFSCYQFTVWIIAVVTAAMIYPAQFLHPAGLDMRNKWIMLIAIQMVMFGMGTQMRLHDFYGVVRSPRGVFVGIFCHFSVMPLVGWGLTKLFFFPPEIAAGVILIGSCSSGLASNVMAYLARSNLALSVTVTAVTTVLAPFLTPLWMKLLAGTLVQISFINMMMDIIKIMVVPIGAALLNDYLRQASPTGRNMVHALTLFAGAWLVALVAGFWEYLQTHLSANILAAVGLGGFVLSAFVIGVVYHMLEKRMPSLGKTMPVLAVVGILYVTAMTTAAGRNNLLKVGAVLFLVSVLHNTAGYLAGYFLSRLAGLEKNCARSVAFEVGLQNGGMASGLANAMGKLGTVGLAAAIFIPWMNVSGSLLANYWAKRPVK